MNVKWTIVPHQGHRPNFGQVETVVPRRNAANPYSSRGWIRCPRIVGLLVSSRRRSQFMLEMVENKVRSRAVDSQSAILSIVHSTQAFHKNYQSLKSIYMVDSLVSVYYGGVGTSNKHRQLWFTMRIRLQGGTLNKTMNYASVGIREARRMQKKLSTDVLK
jgi:hypothetical protein